MKDFENDSKVTGSVEDKARDRAIASTVARIKRGFDLGGGPLVSREALHDRAELRASEKTAPSPSAGTSCGSRI